MHRSRIKTIGLRITTIASAVVAALALTATPAHAATDTLSDTTSWGWTSVVVTWPASSFQVNVKITVNDSAVNGWCVYTTVKLYDYNGTIRGSVHFYDCTVNGIARILWETRDEYPNTIYSASMKMCEFREGDGAFRNCRPYKYAYR
jgi:hypothetical protein